MNGKSRGFAFVVYRDERDATKYKQRMEGKEVKGNKPQPHSYHHTTASFMCYTISIIGRALRLSYGVIKAARGGGRGGGRGGRGRGGSRG